jgi:HK97 family phage major capsid protein
MTDFVKPTCGEAEDRTAPESAALTIEGNTLHGLIPYGIESRDLNGWKEILDPGAFDDTDMSELYCTVRHDRNRILGRFDSTLKVEQRENGLAWSCELPSGPTGQDVKEAVRRGDISGSSWRMHVGRDRWEGRTRHIESIARLADVCVTPDPAYPAASVELRERPQDDKPNPPAEQAETEEHKVDTPHRENGGGGLMVEDRQAEDNANIESRIIEAMAGVPRGEARDLTHATAEAVEPDELSTFVFDALRDSSVLLASGIPVIPTNRKTWKAPQITGDVDTDFVDELEEIKDSDPELDEFEATPRKLAALVRGSSESFEDSSPDLLNLVQGNIAASMALKLDAEGLVGNSSKGFEGLTTMEGTQELDMGEAAMDDYDAIIAAVGLLSEAHVPGPFAVVLHPRVAAYLDRLRGVTAIPDEKGEPVLVKLNTPLPRPDGLPPIYVTSQVGFTAKAGEKVDRSNAVVYAPNALRVIRRKQMELVVDRSREVELDSVLVRGVARAVLAAPYPEGVVVIRDVASPEITL